MKEKHKHIWKYREGSNIRVCEAPIPVLESCGKVERLNDLSGGEK